MILAVSVQVTCCGLTAQAVQGAVTSISVPNQGPQLSYWPPAVSQFSSLTSINLSGNAITFIPQSIQNLQGLQQLLLSRNDLGSLPPEIGALTALTELDVGANKLRKLPDAICSLTGLKVRATHIPSPTKTPSCSSRHMWAKKLQQARTSVHTAAVPHTISTYRRPIQQPFPHSLLAENATKVAPCHTRLHPHPPCAGAECLGQ
jgi:Leucine-rich repeat (LRR) protein